MYNFACSKISKLHAYYIRENTRYIFIWIINLKK